MKRDRAVKNLRQRAAMLSARAALLEQFAESGLTQTDIVNELGVSKPTVSNYFAGRLDSEQIETCIKRLMTGRGVAV